MDLQAAVQHIFNQHITPGIHATSDYFGAIRELIPMRVQVQGREGAGLQQAINQIYELIADEIATNESAPLKPVQFGTSGWRGILGKDLHVLSVAQVTVAILTLYRDAETEPELREALGVDSFAAMRERGCVVGFDNRFGGPALALAACNVLAANGVKIFYAGEATTGILSASVLERKAAFSINLTPSHNPLEYGGFKYNAADAGPAAPILTGRITAIARQLTAGLDSAMLPGQLDQTLDSLPGVEREDALDSWQMLARKGASRHGLQYDLLLSQLASAPDLVIAVDCVHGASRNYIHRLCGNPPRERLLLLRDNQDFTFGGIAPEPSTANMRLVNEILAARPEKFKIGAIIDPDGDRIRFTDGATEISMNQFGAMAYHFLHEILGKKGMVAKTVATSNLANALAKALNEKIFEPKVGFKEFKPVLGKALVFFEESDGISIIGHTPEKDAFIGLILAIAMILHNKKNLGDYLHEIEEQFGYYYPARDGITVAQQGEELLRSLTKLEKYQPGSTVPVGNGHKVITELITIDGRKMLFDDGSWLMIRPSGTEPKVRFYVEARNEVETEELVRTAKSMLAEIGVLS